MNGKITIYSSESPVLENEANKIISIFNDTQGGKIIQSYGEKKDVSLDRVLKHGNIDCATKKKKEFHSNYIETGIYTMYISSVSFCSSIRLEHSMEKMTMDEIERADVLAKIFPEHFHKTEEDYLKQFNQPVPEDFFIDYVFFPERSALSVQQQLEHCSCLVDKWLKNPTDLNIYTYSEAYILRIQKLIASGKIDNEAVTFKFYVQDENSIYKHKTGFDKEGRATGDCPIFDWRLKELFPEK